MNRIRAAGVPTWVTIFAILIAVGGTLLGLASLLNPSEADVPTYFERAYGGRNIGVAIVLGVAVVLRARAAYIAGLVGGLFRDLGDLMRGNDEEVTSMAIVGAVFMFLGLAALGDIARRGRADAIDLERAS
ncbi:MAG: hypothetical protein WBM50_21775 [Acidimicrobiales bacterium]